MCVVGACSQYHARLRSAQWSCSRGFAVSAVTTSLVAGAGRRCGEGPHVRLAGAKHREVPRAHRRGHARVAGEGLAHGGSRCETDPVVFFAQPYEFSRGFDAQSVAERILMLCTTPLQTRAANPGVAARGTTGVGFVGVHPQMGPPHIVVSSVSMSCASVADAGSSQISGHCTATGSG